MANQFGEQVDDNQAYNEAREALGYIKDLSKVEAAADTPVKKAAVADEKADRELNAWKKKS